MNATILNKVSEKALQQTVHDLFAIFQWDSFHDLDGKTSGTAAKGWPDCFATRGNEAVAWELKTMRGRVSKEQIEWIARLNQIPGVDARVIRPSDLDWCEQRLRPNPAQLAMTTSNSTGETGVNWTSQ